MAATKKATGPITVPEVKRKLFEVCVMGDTPLIVHAWSKKARTEMLAKQMGQKLPKYAKSPVKDFLDSLYYTDDKSYAFPATGVKAAMITAVTSMNKEITKIAARQAFWLRAEQGKTQSAFAGLETPMQLVRVHSPNPPMMREDNVRVGMGTADLRYRAEFWPWAMRLVFEYNSNVVSDSTLAVLVDTAGFAVGVGEWRNEKDGIYGSFRLATPVEAKQIAKWEKAGPQKPHLPDEKAFLRELSDSVRRLGTAEEESEA